MFSLIKLSLVLYTSQILWALEESFTGLDDGVSSEKKDVQLRWLKEKCALFPENYNYDFYQEYRIDPKSGECHTLGSDAPCPSNMIFYEDPTNSEQGICDCHRSQSRTLIYHEKSNQCYFIMTQAYCSSGQWLTLNRNSLAPVCEANPCFVSGGRGRQQRQSQSKAEMVLFKGRCVPLGHREPECKEFEYVDFEPGRILPRCTSQNLSGGVGAISRPLPECTPGRLQSLSGKCVKSWEW